MAKQAKEQSINIKKFISAIPYGPSPDALVAKLIAGPIDFEVWRMLVKKR